MAEQAKYVVRDALIRLGVIAAGESIESQDADDCLAVMNDMFGLWEMDGVDLFLPELELSDNVSVPSKFLHIIKCNLAIRVAPLFDVEPAPTIVADADAGYRRIKAEYTAPLKMTVNYGGIATRTNRGRRY